MEIKTKYNIGQVVEFAMDPYGEMEHKILVGRIEAIVIKIGAAGHTEVHYKVFDNSTTTLVPEDVKIAEENAEYKNAEYGGPVLIGLANAPK